MKCWFISVILVVFVNCSCTAKIGYQHDDSEDCKISDYVTKVGCFNDHHRLLNEQLINARDSRSPNYQGLLINWFQLKKTVNQLVCDCAKKAREQGYQYIGLQNFGECWSGTNSQAYDQDGRSTMCMQEYPKPCNVDNNEHGCIGFLMTNYIYRVTPGTQTGMSENKSEEGKTDGETGKGKKGKKHKGKGGKKSKHKSSKSKSKSSKSESKSSKSKSRIYGHRGTHGTRQKKSYM